MANQNEVSSSPAPAANGDGKKDNVSNAGAIAMLLEKAAKAEPAPESANVVATPKVEPPATQEGQQAPAESIVAPATVQQAEPEGEDIEVLSNTSHLDPKTKEIVDAALKSQQAAIDKRIGKEVAKRKALEEQLARAQPTPTQQPLLPQTAQPMAVANTALPSEDPIAKIGDFVTLEKEAETLKSMRRIADDLLMEGPTNPMGTYTFEGKDFTREELVKIRRNAEISIEDKIPKHRQYLSERISTQQRAQAAFQWINKAETQEWQQAQVVLSKHPILKQDANAEILVGFIVEGINAWNAKQAAAQNANAQKPSRPRPPGDMTAIGAVGSANTRVSEAAMKGQLAAGEREALRKKGNVSSRDAAAHLLRLSQLSSSR